MKKIISILVLCLIIGAGIYFFINKNTISSSGESSVQPTEATSADNWKIYSDKNYGFEIKIPADWTGDRSVNDRGVTVYKFGSDKNSNTMIGINVPLESGFKPKTSVTPDAKILNGYNSTHYNVSDGSVEIYVLNHDNQTLAITLFYSQDTKDVVDQIISTFKYN